MCKALSILIIISSIIQANAEHLISEDSINLQTTITRAPCPGPGTFTQIPGSPFTADVNPNSVAFSPNNLFAAVANLNSNNVSVYNVNQITGAFTQVIGSPFATGINPSSVAYSPDGNFAAIANISDSNVSVYSVNQTTGAFTQITGSPFATGGFPFSVAYSPNGLFAATANSSSANVSVHSVNQVTGAFTQIAGSPFAAGSFPESVAYSPNSNFAAVVNTGDNTVSVYSVDQITGAFTQVAGSPFATGINPVFVAYSPDGNFAVITNINDNVNVYSVNQITGALTQVTGSPFATGMNPSSVAFSPNSSVAVVANFGSNDVSIYNVNQATGTFTQIAGSPFAAGSAPASVAYSLNGLFIAVANDNSNNVTVYNTSAAPMAQPTNVTTTCNQQIIFTPQNCGLNVTVSSVTAPSHGTATAITGTNTIEYIPNSDYSGPDSFNYTIVDILGNTSSSIVSVVVTPIAQVTQATTEVNTSVVITPNACGNPTNYAITAVGIPSNGSAIITNAGSTITYTPNTGFTGTDSFSYTIQDALNNTSSSTINVTVFSGTGIVANPTFASTTCASPVSFNVNASGNNISITSLTQPTHGEAIFSGLSIIYRPITSFIGTDTFGYTVSDLAGNTASSTITVLVNPLAPDITVTTQENTPIVINVVQGLCAANTKIVGTTQPANGSAVVTPNLKSVIYTPNIDFVGIDKFTYAVGDPVVGTITVIVTPKRSALSTAIINKYCP